MKTELEALGFTGFYQGCWEQSENEYISTHGLKYEDYEDIENLHLLDDWGFGPDYRDKVTKEYSERYVELVNEVLGTDFKLVDQNLYSPKEYNFRTDEVYCKVEIEDFDNVVDQLVKKVSTDLDLYNVLRETIHKNHTSCDGFWSFMSNDIDEWLGLIYDPDESHYFSYFIGYLVNAIQPGSLSQLNEDICYYVNENTDWHCSKPETDEAKEEWELYLEHRDIYTGFLKEYRKSHIHPNRRDWPEDNRHRYDVDWDEFKEAFSEQIEDYKKEQQRKAWLAAYPTIPGLI